MKKTFLLFLFCSIGQLCFGQLLYETPAPDYEKLISEMPTKSSAYVKYVADNGGESLIDKLYKSGLKRNELVDKMVKVCANTFEWEADEISFLQSVTQDAAIECPALICSTLSKMTRWQQRSFWLFLFSGMYPDNQFYNNVLKIKEFKPYEDMVRGAFAYYVAIWANSLR